MSWREITDAELRIGIGRSGGLPTTGPWYVTCYSRNLYQDRALGWFETYEEAASFSRGILDHLKEAR